jgi:hypothetical protein
VIQAAEETWILFKELDYNEFKHIYRIFDALKGVMAVYTRGEREELYAANLWAERCAQSCTGDTSGDLS